MFRRHVPHQADAPILELCGVAVQYDSHQVLEDISFQLTTGERVALVGPNGAGKSTTMKMITGFLPPTSGTARIGGPDILEDPIQAKRLLGYLPENGPLYGEMTVLEFLNFIAEMRGYRSTVEKAARIATVTEICHLEDVGYQPIETLSKGYRQRVGIAQAVIHDPPYMIMDEPTDGLDPNQKHEVRDLISRMASDKVIILSTHILEEVEAICSRAVVISGGQLVADGTPDELKRKSSWHGAVTLTIHGQDTSGVKQALEGLVNSGSVETLESSTAGEACRYRVFPKPNQAVAADISELTRQKNWQVDELHIEQGRLDEVFRDLTKGQKEREVKI